MKSPLVLWLLLLPLSAWGADQPELKTEKDKINYSVGYQIGGDFKKQGVELSPEILVRGIQDALSEVSPLLTKDEMYTVLVGLKRKILTDQQGPRKLVRQVPEEETAFFAENAKKEGVKTLPSGLQFKSLTSGSGKSPTSEDTVTVHYRATRIDGTEFDSTYRIKKPRTLSLQNLIPGLKEALQLMKEGDRWQIFIPPPLAFGQKGSLAGKGVIYDMELVSVQPHK